MHVCVCTCVSVHVHMYQFTHKVFEMDWKDIF